jgi:hypothetical protein
VRYSDVTESSIPAYKAARGTVVFVSESGKRCRVCWDSDGNYSEPNTRHSDTVTTEGA